jgi:hypothetical protein
VRRRRALLARQRQGDRDQPHGDVHGRGQLERRRDADAADQPESGQHGARDAAGGVGRVEHARVLAQRVRATQRGADDQREGRAHQHGGHQQHGDREDEPHQRERARQVRKDGVQGQVRALDQVQQRGRGQGGHADQDLGAAIEEQGAARAVRPAAAQRAAQRQARHEAGEHRAGRVHGHAEDEPEEPQPQLLVDEPAEAGREEEERDRHQADAAGHLRRRVVVHDRAARGSLTRCGLYALTPSRRRVYPAPTRHAFSPT